VKSALLSTKRLGSAHFRGQTNLDSSLNAIASPFHPRKADLPAKTEW
jgi:hypothetical protein